MIFTLNPIVLVAPHGDIERSWALAGHHALFLSGWSVDCGSLTSADVNQVVQQDSVLSIQLYVFLVHCEGQILLPQSIFVLLLHPDIFSSLLQVVRGSHCG